MHRISLALGALAALLQTAPAPAADAAAPPRRLEYRIAWNGIPAAGASVVDEAAMAPGLTFVARYDGELFGAELLDLHGRVAHRWSKRFSQVWGESPAHLQFTADDKYSEWHGVHLYPDGSLLFNFEGLMFPFGGGLVKIDRNSEVVWKLAQNTHHDVTVTAV